MNFGKFGFKRDDQIVCVYEGNCIRVRYLGDGVFWEVLVGEVTGLDQLAGDLGVWRVRGLPIGA